MDTLTIILATLALGATAGLCWLGGYELGMVAGTDKERELADRRVRGLLEDINTRRPKAAKNRRKAARKAVRA